MFNYAEMATSELIDLLFQEEDRVTLEHIQEIIRRGDEAKPRLLEILGNQDYWYEGQRGEYWIELHVLVILSQIQDPAVVPKVLATVLDSYFAEQRWVIERWPELMAQFGEAAVEPLMGFIREYHDGYKDNSDYSLARSQMARALTLIALDNEGVRQNVLEFLIQLFTDQEERDRIFIAQAVLCPIALDRKLGLEAVRKAFHRRVITHSAYGQYNDVVRYVGDRRYDLREDLGDDLFDFYLPEAIGIRQQRWKSLDTVEFGEEDYHRSFMGPAPFPLPFERLYSKEEVSVPKGYVEAEAGNIVRPDKVGRNDPCICGSGKKYKKCCGA
ncbi:MAG TPA: SEC-C metal-binding domain-containing protein [Blastocatellia bacterium]|nr:SEC-C metal-binding domain-containing protein [Blastocatellia bacterium]